MAVTKEVVIKRPRKKLEMDEETIQNLILKKAYELYEKSGMEHGRDLEHWLEAENIIMGNGKGKIKKGK